jgi:hypothetical protein
VNREEKYQMLLDGIQDYAIFIHACEVCRNQIDRFPAPNRAEVSSVFFYTGRTALLWNGRGNNLEYGSYAPGSPSVFIDDSQFQSLWNSSDRYFVLSDGERIHHLHDSVETPKLYLVAESGGKTLYSNLPVSQ